MSTKSIWETLSAIDCSEHVEKKGKFDYLAWTWAIAMVRKHYPEMTYTIEPDIIYPDGSMEVRCTVTINGLTQPMWLPVTDYNNHAIKTPDSFAVNTARMRCLVKCIAVGFGLGHYIYSGESFPMPSHDLEEKYEELVSLVAAKDCWRIRQFFIANSKIMDELFNLSPDGHKTRFKDDVRKVYGASNDQIKANLAILEDAVGNPDTSYNVAETLDEMTDLEREFTLKGCNEVLRRQVQDKLEEVGGREQF